VREVGGVNVDLESVLEGGVKVFPSDRLGLRVSGAQRRRRRRSLFSATSFRPSLEGGCGRRNGRGGIDPEREGVDEVGGVSNVGGFVPLLEVTREADLHVEKLRRLDGGTNSEIEARKLFSRAQSAAREHCKTSVNF
jgi:hypothetical protein